MQSTVAKRKWLIKFKQAIKLRIFSKTRRALLGVPRKYSILMVGIMVTLFVGLGLFVVLNGKAATCTVANNLVNSCRPLYGAAMSTMTTYPQVAADSVAQMSYHDTRVGHKSDIAHVFNPIGTNDISSKDKALVNNGYTLMLNWKPASPWRSGYSGASNAAIDTMAASLKSLAPRKIMLVIWHEPENDVTPGTAACTVPRGSSGSPSDYVKMWHYTVDRLRADGVSNAVYVQYFQNYKPLTCNNINELYAGDSYVDWIMFDTYTLGGTWGNSLSWSTQVNNFYSFLQSNSTSTHNYVSKPWGISEMGICNEGLANAQAWYDDASAAIKNNTFPNVKAILAYDDNNPSDNGGRGGNELRTAYNDSGIFTQSKQDHYNGLVNAIYARSNTIATPTPVPTHPATPSPAPTQPPIPTVTPAPTPSATPSPRLQGLSATYYSRINLSGTSFSRIDPQINFSWSFNSPGSNILYDNFSARWVGTIAIAKNDSYTFYAKSDDGNRLFIDDVLVIDDWNDHGARETAASIILPAGLHHIRVEYYEHNLLASMKLSWSSKMFDKQIVPAGVLTPVY